MRTPLMKAEQDGAIRVAEPMIVQVRFMHHMIPASAFVNGTRTAKYLLISFRAFRHKRMDYSEPIEPVQKQRHNSSRKKTSLLRDVRQRCLRRA